MPDSIYLRARAAQLITFGYTVTDAASKAALIEVTDNLSRWADELHGIDAPKSKGA